MIHLRIARSVIETSRTGSTDPKNLPRATRKRNLREKKKMPVPLKPRQKTTTSSTNTRKVVSTTGKMTAKTPGSRGGKNIEEESSSRHEGELSSSNSSVSDNNNDDDDGTSAKENTCYVYGDVGGRGDRNNGAGGGFAEWMWFLNTIALSETFGDMAKAKASMSKKARKTRS